MKLRKNIIVSFIVFIGCAFLFEYAFDRPTAINRYIATHVYGAPANTAFTDDNFYQCVVDAYNDENNASLTYTTNLTQAQLNTITKISCSGTNKDDSEKIVDVMGIEKLINLRGIYLSDNLIEQINLNSLTQLLTLVISNNKLKELDISNNTNLDTLSAFNNELSNVAISTSNKLRDVRIYKNKLTNFNTSSLSELDHFDISNNQLTTLSLTSSSKLRYLVASDNLITTINVSNNINLLSINLSNNKLTSVDLTKNVKLKSLYIHNNLLSNINLTKNTLLEVLYVQGNSFTSLNLTNNTFLNFLILREFQPIINDAVYINKSYYFQNTLGNIKLPNSKSFTFSEISPYSSGLNINNDLRTITPTSKGKKIIDVEYIHNIQSSQNQVIQEYNIYVIEATSQKYYINSESEFIYTGTDTDNETILSNISLNYGEAVIENNKLLIKYNSNTIKTFNLVNYSSETYNFDTEYIYLGSKELDTSKIEVINGTLNETAEELQIKYDDEVLATHKLIRTISEEYDLSKEYLYVGPIELDTSKIEVTNGTLNETEEELQVKHGDEVLAIYKLVKTTSEEYDLTKEYIYLGLSELDRSKIEVTNGILNETEEELQIKYDGEVVGSYKLVKISSDVYDLTKDYIFEYNENNLTVTNGSSSKITTDNTIEIKYNDTVIDTYELVEVTSEKYDLSETFIRVEENTINDFILKLNCTNCIAKVFDGTNYITEGSFEDKNYTLRIIYGKEVLKEYSLTFPVSGVDLNKENIRLGLENKKTVQLESIVTPSNAENHSVTWKSSNDNIATVDENGLVTSVGLGKATITVITEDGGYTDTVEVEVLELVTYGISYKDGDNVYTEYYEEDEEVTLKSDLTKKGYTLLGWKYNETEHKLTDAFTMPAEDIELEAIWTPNKYEVTYNLNNETFEVTYDSKYGDLITPSKKGYTLKGWYLEESFKNEVTKDTIVNVDKNHTLYAKFDINSYKLTINPNGGEYAYEDELTINYNEEITLEEPTRKGYTFKGWEIIGEESVIDDNKFTMGISDSTLKAKWKIIIPDIEKTSEYVLKDKLITGISLGTIVEDFDLGLDEIYTTKIVSGKEKELLGTGDKVQIYLDNTLVVEYIVVIKGDVSGDGKATVADYSKAYQYFKKRITMEDCFIEASDVVKNDSVITMAEVSKIYQFIKGRINTLD